MTNKKSRLLVLLLAALTPHPTLKAQNTEISIAAKPTRLQQEILDLDASIQLNGNTVVFNEDANTLDLSEDLDYLSTSTLLSLINKEEILNHPNISKQLSTSKDISINNNQFTKEGSATITCKWLDAINLNKVTIKNVRCLTLQDKYSVKAPLSGITFTYTNKYYLFFDASKNNLLTCISYIKRESSYLSTEFKLVDNQKTALSINNVADTKIELEILPNPSDYMVHIKFSFATDVLATIQIVDLQGRLVKQIISNSTFIKGEHELNENISSLPTGQYFVKMIASGAITTEKLIVKH